MSARVNIFGLLLLLLVLPSEPKQCFSVGECKDSFQILGNLVDNQYLCRKECQVNPYCKWFTYFKKTNYCQLYRDCEKLEESSCAECLSGERDCSAPEIKCWLTGKCQGDPFSKNETQTSEECLEVCQTTTDCEWFTFDERKQSCLLFTNCTDLVGCDNCLTGNTNCEVDSKESEWHLIIGGAGSPNTVELFNWRTFQHCQLPDLPVGVYGHVASSMKGVPVFCEGGQTRKSCYKMDKTTKKWVSIANLIAGVEFGKSIFVPSHGWAIFGKLGNNLEKSQLLASLDDEWKEGPELINSDVHKEKQCMFKINEIKTGFLYSKTERTFNYNHGYHRENLQYNFIVKEFDWSTMSYEEKKVDGISESNDIHAYSICTVYRHEDNEKLIISTENKMPMIQMDTTAFKYTNEDFTARLSKDLFKENTFTQLLAVNNKTELFLYGGQYNDDIMDGIWRYSPVTKLWMLVGKMKYPRAGHTVTPVQGLNCP